MLNLSMLLVFIPTFFFVSATPGMCMTLSLTLGMTIGVKRSLWMMAGELVGVGLIVVLSMVGVATLLLTYPSAFTAFKLLGGLYLAFLGLQLWQSKGRLAISDASEEPRNTSPWQLISQGFMTAIFNPKGWTFMVALLPPFIDPTLSLMPQLSVLLAIILLIEFLFLLLYASGGQSLSHLLLKRNNVRLLNRIAGTLMIGVSIWLISA